ncbi:MAG: hypothetical protein QG576_1002 [Bacteroidota bacterium]|nr:hypothetical protein [Bacteroidota bacterium]
MSVRTKLISLLITDLIGIMFLGTSAVIAGDSISLYTPYTRISVPPGESIEYTIDVINKSSEIKNVGISVTGIPKSWSYDLKSGGWKIGQLSILPGEKKNLVLKVDVPFQVNKGSYRFHVVAAGFDVLPLTVIVSEQGTYKTEFTSDQANMEGRANATFTFQAGLKNRTGESQLYALMVNPPQGWNVAFKSDYKQVTSVNIEPNSEKQITIEIDPPDIIEAGPYKIPIRASTSTTSASLDLEVVITGSFGIELTTPTGLLSTDITAGDEKRIELAVRNTGSAELKDIKLNFTAPAKWDVIFDPKIIDKLESGKTAQVFATVKADKRAIAGDYVTNMEAKTAEGSSKASFRISVETPMLWGWIGVLIIFAACGSVYYLFRKYGRR